MNHPPIIALVLALGCLAAACQEDAEPLDEDTTDAADASDASDTTDAADTTDGESGDESTGEAAVCGDGIVQGDEACDEGPDGDGQACNDRCLVPGSVAWTWELENQVFDLAVTAERLLACGSSLQLLDPHDRSIVDVDGPPGEGCERVAAAPDGGFAALAWESGPLSDYVGVASYDADGTMRWSVPQVELHDTVFGRPALAFGPEGELVAAGSVEPDFDSTMRVVQFDAQGEVAWNYMAYGPVSSEATAVTIAPNGQVVVAGYNAMPPSGTAIAVRVVDGGEEIYETAKDLIDDEVDLVSSVVLAEDGRVVVAGTRATGPYVAAFAPPSLSMLWDVAIAEEEWGNAPALALHPSGAIVAVHADLDSMTLRLLDTSGQTLWQHTWPRTSVYGYVGDASVAVDEEGDVYVAFADSQVSKIVSPVSVDG